MAKDAVGYFLTLWLSKIHQVKPSVLACWPQTAQTASVLCPTAHKFCRHFALYQKFALCCTWINAKYTGIVFLGVSSVSNEDIKIEMQIWCILRLCFLAGLPTLGKSHMAKSQFKATAEAQTSAHKTKLLQKASKLRTSGLQADFIWNTIKLNNNSIHVFMHVPVVF